VILNAKKNPNFSMMVKHVDIELPEQEMYCPPLTIRVVDCRSEGTCIFESYPTGKCVFFTMHRTKLRIPSLVWVPALY
jgi:hypothetical protein